MRAPSPRSRGRKRSRESVLLRGLHGKRRGYRPHSPPRAPRPVAPAGSARAARGPRSAAASVAAPQRPVRRPAASRRRAQSAAPWTSPGPRPPPPLRPPAAPSRVQPCLGLPTSLPWAGTAGRLCRPETEAASLGFRGRPAGRSPGCKEGRGGSDPPALPRMYSVQGSRTPAVEAGPGGLYVGVKCQGRMRRPRLDGRRGPVALKAGAGGRAAAQLPVSTRAGAGRRSGGRRAPQPGPAHTAQISSLSWEPGGHRGRGRQGAVTNGR